MILTIAIFFAWVLLIACILGGAMIGLRIYGILGLIIGLILGYLIGVFVVVPMFAVLLNWLLSLNPSPF